MGMLAWLPYLCATSAHSLEGLASGHLIKRGWRDVVARQAAMIPCALVMPCSIAIALTPSSVIAVLLICLVTFSHMAWKTNLMTITTDIYPTRLVGSASSRSAAGLAERCFMHPVAFLVFRLLVKGPIVIPARTV